VRLVHRDRIRLRRVATLPAGRALQRLDGARLVDVDHRVELVGQSRPEVVADALGLRPVDHADCPLQPWLTQSESQRLGSAAQAEVEPRDLDGMEQRFVALREPRADALALGRLVPV
jgi:hypothetical protein